MKLRQTTVQLGKRAGFDDVGHRLGLTTGAQIEVCKAQSLSTGCESTERRKVGEIIFYYTP